MMYDRSQMLDQMVSFSAEYTESHLNARTSSGKERLQVVQDFRRFCMNEKTLMGNEAAARYFKGKTMDEARKGISETEFTRMKDELDVVKRGRMTEDKVIDYTNKLSKCLDACEIYLDQHKGTMIGSRTAEYTQMQRFVEANKPALDSMRDLREVRGLIKAGKSWDDLHALRVATHVISGPVELAGANSSQRIKTTVNGKTGFFTQELMETTFWEAMDRYAKENPNGQLIRENMDLLNDEFTETDLIFRGNDNDRFFNTVCGRWSKMPNSQEKKQMQDFLADGARRQGMNSVYENYAQKLAAAEPWLRSDKQWKQTLFRNVVAENVKNPEEVSIYTKFSDIMMESAEANPIKKGYTDNQKRMTTIDKLLYSNMLKQDLNTVQGRNVFEANQRLLDSKATKEDFITLHLTAYGAYQTRSLGKMQDRDNINLANRNIVTSRLAEVMGMGNLVAHSRSMEVDVNGRKLKGCFMEFAEGIDADKTENFDDLSKISQVDPDKLQMDLAREDNKLHFFDMVCAQRDRHGGNFFLKLSEPDQKGERRVIGLQGIDNDQAFTRSGEMNDFGKTYGIDSLTFIDADMKKSIMGLTREKIEYAVGPMLSEHEIDGIVTRVNTIQEYIKTNKFIELSGDEWKLDGKKELSKADQMKYEAGVASLEKAIASKYEWDNIKFNHSKASGAIRGAQERYTKMKGEHEDYKAKVQELNETVKAHEASDKTKKDRASIFDRIVSEKSRSKDAPAATTQQRSERVSVSLKEMEGKTNTSQRSTTFTKHEPNKQAQRSGFTMGGNRPTKK